MRRWSIQTPAENGTVLQSILTLLLPALLDVPVNGALAVTSLYSVAKHNISRSMHQVSIGLSTNCQCESTEAMKSEQSVHMNRKYIFVI